MARERAGLTQGALARRARMTTSQVSQVESGKRSDPQFSTVLRLAVALNLSLDEVAALGGFPSVIQPVAKSRDPLARTESILLRLQRDALRCKDHIDEAIRSLPTMPRRKG